MNLNKISQEIRYRFNAKDDSFFIKAQINMGISVIKFEAKNIWLNDLTSSDKYQLRKDLKDLSEFLIQLSEELPCD